MENNFALYFTFRSYAGKTISIGFTFTKEYDEDEIIKLSWAFLGKPLEIREGIDGFEYLISRTKLIIKKNYGDYGFYEISKNDFEQWEGGSDLRTLNVSLRYSVGNNPYRYKLLVKDLILNS